MKHAITFVAGLTGLSLLVSPALAQMGARDAIFRSQDAYQQGRAMGDGDLSGLLGIAGNMIPDEGGSFSAPGALLTGVFGLLGTSQVLRKNAQEKMDEEMQQMMHQMNAYGGYGYGAYPPPYPGPGNYYGSPYAQQGMPGAHPHYGQPGMYPPQYPQPGAPQALASAAATPAPPVAPVPTPKPTPDPVVKAAEQKRQILSLDASLDGLFDEGFSTVAPPAASDAPPMQKEEAKIEEELEESFELPVRVVVPKM